MFDGLLEFSIGHQQVAKIVVGLGVVRINPQGLKIFLFGGRPVSLSGKSKSQIVVSIFVFGIQLHCCFELHDRLVNFPLRQQLSSPVLEVGCLFNIDRLSPAADSRFHRSRGSVGS